MPLLLKDILCLAVDLDPFATINPYPFPRNHDSPHLFRQIFTCDEFRTFWHHERNAFQWKYFSERNSRSFYNEKFDPETPLPTPTVSSTGRPRSFDWSVKFVCRQHDQEKALLVKRESVGKDCPVTIRIQKLCGQDLVAVEYYWVHSHATGIDAKSRLPLGKSEAHWAKKRIMEGHTWKGIRQILTPTEEMMDQLERGEKSTPPGLLIKYDDIRTAAYRQHLKVYRKHKGVVTSVRLWLEHIESTGGKGRFVDKEDKQNFMIAWCTKFQLKIMGDNKLIACMDSTHKTVKSLWSSEDNHKVHSDAYLFTLLVKDRKLLKGVPIAFMITNTES
ncbi:hypothetical protein BGX20_003308, partial [Mortierella sp. AD010]